MNLEEVARRAKVSTATVSRALNKASMVRSSTRMRVLQAVEELKYQPNLNARSLAGVGSRSIGVIVSNIENPFFLDIYKAVESDARAEGYEILVADTAYRSEQFLTSVRLMIGRRVAGIAAIVSEIGSDAFTELRDHQVPVVAFDAGAAGPQVTSIKVNYRHGSKKLIDYLYSLGHRRIGFVGTPGLVNGRANVVLESAARYSDMAVRTGTDGDSLEGGRRATRALLSADSGLTAIVCVNDLMAIGAMRELRERGLRVPEDISVTGFDNLKLSQFCNPALTTVDVPRGQIGQNICDVLVRNKAARIEHEILIDPELVLRDSTGPAQRR